MNIYAPDEEQKVTLSVSDKQDARAVAYLLNLACHDQSLKRRLRLWLEHAVLASFVFRPLWHARKLLARLGLMSYEPPNPRTVAFWKECAGILALISQEKDQQFRLVSPQILARLYPPKISDTKGTPTHHA
jgi:hypothetical protein